MKEKRKRDSEVREAISSAQSVRSESDLKYKACSGRLGFPKASASKSVASHKRYFFKAKGIKVEGRVVRPRDQT